MRSALPLISALTLLGACNGGAAKGSPTKAPDLSAGHPLRYVSGGGEAGAPYTDVLVESDGTVTWTDAGTMDFKTNVYPKTVRRLKLDAAPQKALLAELEQAGVWGLEPGGEIGADRPSCPRTGPR